jgi:hypothetical protein
MNDYQELWDLLFQRIIEWREVEKNLDAKIALEDVLDEMILLEEI